MLKNISLRFKLVFTFFIISSIISGVSYYQINATKSVNELTSNLVNDDVSHLVALNSISASSAALRGKAFEYRTQMLENNSAAAQATKQAITTASARLTQDTSAYKNLIEAKEGISTEDLQRFVQQSNQLIETTLQLVTATEQRKGIAVVAPLETQLSTQRDAFDAIVASHISREQQNIATKNQQITRINTSLLNTIIGLAIGTAALALIMGIVVAGWLSRRLSKLREGAERIANGDLSQPITPGSHDEVGQLGLVLNHMRERLKESYRRLAIENQRDVAILESMGEGLVVIDETSRIALLNDIAAQMLETTKDAVPGKLFHEAFPLYTIDNKLVPPDRTVSALSMQNKRAISDVLSHPRKDGRKMLINLNAGPVIVDQKIAGAVIVMRDVTKEKEVDRMKTEFISLASHQLRTPLSAIKWFTEMLLSGDAGALNPDQKDFTQNISDSSERMIQLVNSLLNISRIESGRIMISPQPTDLKELVGGIINDLKAKTEERKQTLVVSVHHDMPKINLDPRLIGQVYLNLLTNAVKYTPKGGEISVFISKKDGQIISQVTDNGYGIPKDEQPRLFQKFFRASNAVEVETDGTGLGLYLIKAIIESSGGKIWFESEVGKGTSFWFSIPETGMIAKQGEVTLDA